MNGIMVDYFDAETRRARIVVYHANGYSQDIGFVVDKGDFGEGEANRLNQEILGPVKDYLEWNFVPCPICNTQFDYMVSFDEPDKIVLKNEDGNPHVVLFSPLPDEIINTVLMWNRHWGWVDLRRFWGIQSKLYCNDVVPINSLKGWQLIVNRADCVRLVQIGSSIKIDIGACFEHPNWAKVFVKIGTRMDEYRWLTTDKAQALVIPPYSNPDNASDLIQNRDYREDITRIVAQIAKSISEADNKVGRAEDICRALSCLSVETSGAYILVPPQTVLEQIKQISAVGKR